MGILRKNLATVPVTIIVLFVKRKCRKSNVGNAKHFNLFYSFINDEWAKIILYRIKRLKRDAQLEVFLLNSRHSANNKIYVTFVTLSIVFR